MTDNTSLAAALSAFQAELPKLRKDETAKVTGESKTGAKVSYSYGYAGLDQVCDTVLPVLGKHGLSITSKTTWSDGAMVLEVSLLHESGERETGFWPLPDPRRSGPQDLGSAMTYGRRYLTLALTGTFPGGEDDDGAQAQARSERDRREDAKPQREAPPAAPKSWSDDELAELHSRILTLPIGNAVSGYDWMASQGLHDRRIPSDVDEPVSATEVLAYRLSAIAIAPSSALYDIAVARTYAEDRGLMKTPVSDTETLEQVLTEAKNRIERAAQEPTSGDGEAAAASAGSA